MDNIAMNVVSGDQIGKEENSVVLPEKSEKPTLDAIPDLELLTDNIFDIVEYLERDDIIKLTKEADHIVLNTLNNKYGDSVPYSMLKILLDYENREENVERILDMLKMLKKAKSGKYDLEEAEKDFTDKVNERYLYSKYGGKNNFEKALANAVAKERLMNAGNTSL